MTLATLTQPATAGPTVTLRVYGEPVPQGSKKAFRIKGTNRSVVVDENKAGLRSWREGIAQAGRDWLAAGDDDSRRPIEGPVALAAVFFLTKPASLPRWRWLPWTRPDVDKLTRALLDGLSSIVFTDDARVTDLVVRKRYALGEAPGVEVSVSALNERSAT